MKHLQNGGERYAVQVAGVARQQVRRLEGTRASLFGSPARKGSGRNALGIRVECRVGDEVERFVACRDATQRAKWRRGGRGEGSRGNHCEVLTERARAA